MIRKALPKFTKILSHNNLEPYGSYDATHLKNVIKYCVPTWSIFTGPVRYMVCPFKSLCSCICSTMYIYIIRRYMMVTPCVLTVHWPIFPVLCKSYHTSTSTWINLKQNGMLQVCIVTIDFAVLMGIFICDCLSKNPTCSHTNWNSFYCSSL